MIKERIARSFDRSAASYDKAAYLQRECADKLLSMMKDNIGDITPRSILDIGTGTGYLAKGLRSLYPGVCLTINDIAPRMLGVAMSNIYPSYGVKTILGDMDYASHFGKYDLVASNLALQWSSDIFKTIKSFSEKSQYFAFTCLLDGSFREWQENFDRLSITRPLYNYPTKTQLEGLVSKLGSTMVESFEVSAKFRGAKDVVRYFKDLGATVNRKCFSVEEIRKLASLSGDQSLHYKVFFCVLKR